MISQDQRDAYLQRIGLDRPPPATLDGLRELHLAHLRHVPFENLSIHLDEDIALAADALVAKLIDRGRGGFCYELNGAFAALLEQLGFRVTLLAARVYDQGGIGPPFDHMCLRVDLEEPWLADVGFGDSFQLPLRLRTDEDQVDEAGTFRIEAAEEDALRLDRDGTAQYRFDLIPRALEDFAQTCRYHQTSQESHFTRGTVCSLLTPQGRVTIRGRTLITSTPGGRTERDLGEDELLHAYRQHFGIALPRLPRTP